MMIHMNKPTFFSPCSFLLIEEVNRDRVGINDSTDNRNHPAPFLAWWNDATVLHAPIVPRGSSA